MVGRWEGWKVQGVLLFPLFWTKPSAVCARWGVSNCIRATIPSWTEKSFEYGKCLETAKEAKSFEYGKCLETGKQQNPLKFNWNSNWIWKVFRNRENSKILWIRKVKRFSESVKENTEWMNTESVLKQKKNTKSFVSQTEGTEWTFRCLETLSVFKSV